MSDLDSPYLQASQVARYKAAMEGADSLAGQDWSWVNQVATAPKKPPEPGAYPAMMIRGVARGIDELGAGMGGAVAAGGRLVGSDTIKGLGEGITQIYQAREKLNPAERTGDLWSSPSKFRYVSESLMESLPQFAAFLVPSLVGTRLAVAGATMKWSPEIISRLAWIGSRIGSPAMFGTMDLGQAFNDVKARGGTDDDALHAAVQMGLASTALGAINLHYILGEGGRLAARMGKGATSVAAINFLQGQTRAAVLGDDHIAALKASLNSLPAMAILGGGAAAALGRGPARAPRAPKVEPLRSASDRIQELREEFQNRMKGEGFPPPAEPTVAEPSATERGVETMRREAEIQRHPDFQSLVFFLLDGKKGTGPQRADAVNVAMRIVGQNPQGTIADFIPAAMSQRAQQIAPEVKAGEPGPAGPVASPEAAVPGEPDITRRELITEMQGSVQMAAGEPISGTRVAVPAGEEVSSAEVSGGLRWIGSKSMKPDWMKDPDRPGKYYASEDVLKVIEKLKRGERPTTALQERIWGQIEEAIRRDAEDEKARLAGAGIAPPSEAEVDAARQRQVNEEQIKTGFFADVERMSQEEAAARPFSIVEPPEAEAAPELSPWQQGMVRMAQEAKAAPEVQPSPEAEHLPGFKPQTLPGGAGGPMAALFNRIVADTDVMAQAAEAKGGEVGDVEMGRRAGQAIRDKRITAQQILDWGPETIVPPEQAYAAKAIGEGALTHAFTLLDLALGGEFDMGAARSSLAAAIVIDAKASAVFSLYGRGLRLAGREVGVEPVSQVKLADVMPLIAPSGGVDIGSPDAARQLSEAIRATAGSDQMALEMMAGLKSQKAREALGRLWLRTGRAGMELFFGSLLGPRTAAKIVLSGTAAVTAYDIGVTRVAEAGRRILNVIAPDKVSAVQGIVRGTTWAKMQGLVAGVTDAWQGINEMYDALNTIRSKEGWSRAEQQLVTVAQHAFPEWARGVKGWKFNRAITGENFPEASEFWQKFIDVTGVAARWTTDSVTAAHAWGYTVQDRIGAYAKAHEIAVREGRDVSYEQQLVAERPPEIDDAAMRTAKENTFIDDFTGKIGQLVGAGSNSIVKITGFPFLKIPLKIFEYTLEGTPGIQHLMKGWREDAFGKDPARRDLAWSKVAVGWGGMTALVAMAANGYLTGSAPKSQVGRDIWKAEGITPYSFKVPGTDIWISYLGLEPLSGWLGIAADANAILRDVPGHEGYDYLWAVLLAAGEEFSNKPFMQGFSHWLKVFGAQDPNTQMRALKDAITPPLPFQSTLDIGRKYSDDVRREVRGITDRWLNRVPGWSDSLPPDRNMITGEPLLYEGAWGPDAVSPFASSTERNNPVLQELIRLKGANISPVPWQIGGRAPGEFVEFQPTMQMPGVALTAQQRDRWIMIMTQELTPGGKSMQAAMADVVNSAREQGQSDLIEAARLQHVWNIYRVSAMNRLLSEDRELDAKVKGLQAEKQIQRKPTVQQPAARERAGIIGLGR